MEATLSSPVKARTAISSGVIGMIFLLATEIMFFAGLISAYIVNKAGSAVWPPYGQPRLPVEVTAVNTAVLLLSGVLLFLFVRRAGRGESTAKEKKLLTAAILLGAAFLLIQGTEWVRLLGFGLTTTSSLYGAFFYLIIGAHAVHALAGLSVLLYLFYFLKNTSSKKEAVNKARICSMYWYFVAGIWPVLYYLVYLS